MIAKASLRAGFPFFMEKHLPAQKAWVTKPIPGNDWPVLSGELVAGSTRQWLGWSFAMHSVWIPFPASNSMLNRHGSKLRIFLQPF
jgi:hypothetical protein